MSKALDIADAMAAHLETLPEMAGIDVMVYRQKDIDSEILQAVEKAKGCAVVILYVGSKSLYPDRPGLIVSRVSYSVGVHTLPVLRDGQTPADNLIEEIQKSLHGWMPENAELCYEAMRFEGDELVPDKNFLVYDLQFNIQLRIK